MTRAKSCKAKGKPDAKSPPLGRPRKPSSVPQFTAANLPSASANADDPLALLNQRIEVIQAIRCLSRRGGVSGPVRVGQRGVARGPVRAAPAELVADGQTFVVAQTAAHNTGSPGDITLNQLCRAAGLARTLGLSSLGCELFLHSVVRTTNVTTWLNHLTVLVATHCDRERRGDKS